MPPSVYIQRSRFWDAIAFVEGALYDPVADPVETYNHNDTHDLSMRPTFDGQTFVQWILFYMSESHINIERTLVQHRFWGKRLLMEVNSLEALCNHDVAYLIICDPGVQSQVGFSLLKFEEKLWWVQNEEGFAFHMHCHISKHLEMLRKPGISFFRVEVK